MSITLRRLDEKLLRRLAEAAIQGADPAEVMPVEDPKVGWTKGQQAGFLTFHRNRSLATSPQVTETTYAIIDGDGEVVGAGRLESRSDGVEVGIWISRRVRRTGVARDAVTRLIAQAQQGGATSVVAQTSSTNRAAIGALRALGAVLTERDGAVHAQLTCLSSP